MVSTAARPRTSYPTMAAQTSSGQYPERVGETEGDAESGAHLQCPFCTAYAVARLFVASVDMDSCECASCGARWDEERGSGTYKGRATPSSILVRRP